MPLYEYICDNCGNNYEEWHGMSAAHPSKCDKCGAVYGEAFHQNYQASSVTIGTYPVTTFGQQAEINLKREGKEGMRRIVEAEKAKRVWGGKIPKGLKPTKKLKGEKPWWRTADKPIDTSKMKPEQVVKYIKTGEKS